MLVKVISLNKKGKSSKKGFITRGSMRVPMKKLRRKFYSSRNIRQKNFL